MLILGSKQKLVKLLTYLTISILLAWPVSMHADQAQYFYDELGRLVGVVDGSGNVAIYRYDDVGNLLAIERPNPGTGVGIFLLAPSSARVGTTVTIQGFGFDGVAANNQVTFNATTASVVSATATSIVATVPTGATTGPVTITNSNGTATSAQPFTVLVPPTIISISPNRVPQGATVQAVIGGFNLGNATSVTFSPSNLSAVIVPGPNPQELTMNLTVPAGAPLQAYTFSVVTPGGTTQSGTVTVTVTQAVPSFNVGKGSVFKQGPPSGPSFGLTKGSVLMP